MGRYFKPLALSLALVVCARAPAGDKAAKKPAPGKAIVLRVPRFLPSALAIGAGQVSLAELAGERAAKKQTRSLARALAKDHKRINGKLKDLARERGLGMPGPSDETRRALARLAKLKGITFDRAYLRLVVQDHLQAIALYKAQARSTDDVELRDFAARTLPALRGHLEQAQALTGTLGAK
jgi:putative membrane protein